MAFAPKNELTKYVQSPPPTLPGSERLHLDRELRKLSQVLDRLVAGVAEIQDHLKTLP